jgi:hypothetical protein
MVISALYHDNVLPKNLMFLHRMMNFTVHVLDVIDLLIRLIDHVSHK